MIINLHSAHAYTSRLDRVWVTIAFLSEKQEHGQRGEIREISGESRHLSHGAPQGKEKPVEMPRCTFCSFACLSTGGNANEPPLSVASSLRPWKP